MTVKYGRGQATRTVSAYEGMVSGTIGVGFPAQAIYQERLECLELIVQNDPSSAGNVTVGDIDGQHIVLIPGASISLPYNDVNGVYAGTPGGEGATVNWLAFM